MRTPLALLLLTVLTCACAPSTAPPKLDHVQWQAWFDSPGGELPFGLEIEPDADGHKATLINGEERLPISEVRHEGSSIIFEISHYDSRIEATLSADGHALDGMWERTAQGTSKSRLRFHARAIEEAEAATTASDEQLQRIDGRWAVQFESDDQPAVGIFKHVGDGLVHGTFLTTTGDYRYLAGSFDGKQLQLSVFDGAHAFLFKAQLAEDGTLSGDFWSRDSWHEQWSARRDDEIELPDAFELTHWVEGDLGDLAYPDMQGTQRRLDDPAFNGKARILVIFGSWCPNCGDASEFLVEMHRSYRERGLSILGLAFEMTGDLARDTKQLAIYREHHAIEYPTLIAGVSDKDEASRAFPLLDRIRSYPTMIFIDRNGEVRAVHQGFNGPATGKSYDAMRRRLEDLILTLLDEAEATG
jgi:hypothetical protein